MIQRLKPDVDVVNDVLKTVLEAKPDSTFIKSLFHQYQERGGLSKKQLEGLYLKASKVPQVSSSKLTTLEAIIKKKPTRYKSAMPAPAPLYTKDENTEQLLDTILAKMPQHKRVLFLKAKYDNNVPLSTIELRELQKFKKILD